MAKWGAKSCVPEMPLHSPSTSVESGGRKRVENDDWRDRKRHTHVKVSQNETTSSSSRRSLYHSAFISSDMQSKSWNNSCTDPGIHIKISLLKFQCPFNPPSYLSLPVLLLLQLRRGTHTQQLVPCDVSCHRFVATRVKQEAGVQKSSTRRAVWTDKQIPDPGISVLKLLQLLQSETSGVQIETVTGLSRHSDLRTERSITDTDMWRVSRISCFEDTIPAAKVESLSFYGGFVPGTEIEFRPGFSSFFQGFRFDSAAVSSCLCVIRRSSLLFLHQKKGKDVSIGFESRLFFALPLISLFFSLF